MKDDFFSMLRVKITTLSRREVLEKVDFFMKKYGNRKDNQCYIVTPNPEIALQSIRNSKLRRAMNEAYISLPDGIGLKFAAFLFGKKIPHRISGADFMLYLCAYAEKRGYSVGLLGGGEGVARKAREKLIEKYSKLNIVYADSGITQDNFSLDDQNCIDAINKANPKILLVGFGAPKQELWIYENLKKVPGVKLAMVVGGSLDFVSGKAKRAPKFIRNLGFEWIYRLLKQPWRIKRIYNATFKFMFTVLWWRIRLTYKYRKNVAGLILNEQGKVLLVVSGRFKGRSWQIPQGGVELGESPQKAIIREMSEELGTNKFEIIKHVSDYNKYDWPSWAKIIQGYKGQSQDLFILKFTGSNSDFNLSKEGELVEFGWFDKASVLNVVASKRNDAVGKALGYLD